MGVGYNRIGTEQISIETIANAIWLLLGGMLVLYFKRYLTKKAENLATKEDIEKLTRIEEEVKAEFKQFFESQRSENQLRLAVVERRFQAHQEAHTLWIELFYNVHTDENSKTIGTCQDWWKENSLYLDPKARAAFIKAVNAAAFHRFLLDSPRNPEAIDNIKDNWHDIFEAGEIIEAAVNLPSLETSPQISLRSVKPTALGNEPMNSH